MHDYAVEVIVEATCFENGLYRYTCACGDTYEEGVPAPGHDYRDKVVKPTDYARGYTEHTCTRCGDSYKDSYVESLKNDGSHTHDYKIEITKEPKCFVNGERTYTCKTCGDTYTEGIPAAGHQYKTSKVAATCTQRGYTQNTCEKCGHAYKSSYTNALGHNFSNWKSLSSGEHQAACTRCGETKKEAHKTSAKVTKEATCNANGVKTYTCATCGYSYNETIVATGKHHYKTEVVKPTENKGGYTLYTCTTCGNSYKDNYTDPTGTASHTHNWEEKTTKKATCEAAGTITHTCKSCGEHWDEETKPLGHDYKSTVTAPTCTTQGYTTWKCSRCSSNYKDSYKDATGHKHTEVRNKKTPTCTAEGYTGDTYCLDCKTTIQSGTSVAKLSHTPELRGKKDATCTAEGYTGDKYCKVCETKLETGKKIDKKPHTEEVRNKREATCTTEGYTGDTYCSVCQTRLKTGQTIGKTAHSWSFKKTTKEGTCTEKSKELWECSACHTTETRDGAINPDNHDWRCTKEAWDETVTKYEDVDCVIYYVEWYPYPKGDPRTFDRKNQSRKEFVCRYDDMTEYQRVYSEYKAFIKEIKQQAAEGLVVWIGDGDYSEQRRFEVGTEIIHHEAEYTCSRCGAKK